MSERQRVGITGAGGIIGRVLRERLAGDFDLRPLDREDADVTDLVALERAFAGVDAVVHLAASAAVDSGWNEVLPANLVGAYHAFEAALRAGVRRVVFASSNHAMGMYLHDDHRFADPDHPVEVSTDAPVRPDSLYGASKAWGEALGRFYAERLGLSVVCLRIGWVTADDGPPPSRAVPGEPPAVAERAPAMWMSHRDCAALVAAALTADVGFAIVHGVGDNRGRWFSLDEGRRLLGWEPRDRLA